jgi:hypothetical protein
MRRVSYANTQNFDVAFSFQFVYRDSEIIQIPSFTTVVEIWNEELPTHESPTGYVFWADSTLE